jgi:hypothetical protein
MHNHCGYKSLRRLFQPAKNSFAVAIDARPRIIRIKRLGGDRCPAVVGSEVGMFFDNLVVTTSILILQPVEDW